MPDPYLKKRFENFIKLNPTIKSHTNAEAYELQRREAIEKSTQEPFSLKNKQTVDDGIVPGWSFISPKKENE